MPFDIGLGNDFLDMTPKPKDTRKKVFMGLYQTKIFCTAQETNNRVKRTYKVKVNIASCLFLLVFVYLFFGKFSYIQNI